MATKRNTTSKTLKAKATRRAAAPAVPDLSDLATEFEEATGEVKTMVALLGHIADRHDAADEFKDMCRTFYALYYSLGHMHDRLDNAVEALYAAAAGMSVEDHRAQGAEAAARAAVLAEGDAS